MNRRLIIAAAALACASWSRAQTPGKPEDNGLNPVSETLYVNTTDTINNLDHSTESIGVAIAKNGNILLGWENDGDGMTDLEAVWTMFDRDGKSITPDVEQSTLYPDLKGQKLTSKFLSFFANNTLASATPGLFAWGPKIKANPFGDGVGMGATAFGLGFDIPFMKDIMLTADGSEAGDWPAVQLLDNNGNPLGSLSGVTADYAERSGNIRIADWDYLGNGNIAIVGESRQSADLQDIYLGEAGATHPILRIVDNKGVEKKAIQLLSATATKSEMWHGVAVARTNFAVRFAGDDGQAKVRFFDNNGNASSTNINLATLAGNAIMGTGGRGDGVGFHGNGVDAFVAVAGGTDPADGKVKVWVTVINANGTVRWSKSVSDDLTLTGVGRCDAAIDALGRVVVVYPDKGVTGDKGFSLIHGRLFKANGDPVGKTFLVSEKETPDTAVSNSDVTRVAFRNDIVAVSWVSRNSGNFSIDDNPKAGVVGLRTFVIPVTPAGLDTVKLTRIVPDTPIINPGRDSLNNWEPYASSLGNNTFLIEGNTFAEGVDNEQRFVVAIQPAAGGAMKQVEGFYGDDNKPYKGQINASRRDGNPGRVAGDQRPGAVNYVVGAEASPHVYDAFTPSRWNTGFDRLADGRYGTIQSYRLDLATLTPTPLTKAIDSANGRLTTGTPAGSQISRFGGELVFLDNGNFVSVVQDNSRIRTPNADSTVATIFATDGTVVKESWVVSEANIWSNLAAVKGGFVIRSGGLLYFYNNAGVLQGSPVNQNTSGESYGTDRGDGTRIAGHINSPYVFLAGKVTTGPVVRVSVWDSRTQTYVATAEVSEGGFRGDFDRANLAVDAYNNVVIGWDSKPDGYEQVQVATRIMSFDEASKSIKPLTASFLPFINNSTVGGIRSTRMSLAMTTKQILIAAKGEINLANKPALGADSPTQLDFYTVISHPNPQDFPASSGIVITGIQKSGANVTVQWTGGTPPFKVQKRALVNSGSWVDAATTSERTATIPADGAAGFIRIAQ